MALRQFEIARGTPLPITSTFTINGAVFPLTGCRVVFRAVVNLNDPDSVAVSLLDNQGLGGVVVPNPNGNVATSTMPASATYSLPTSVTKLFYEVWVRDPSGNPWRTERGTILLVGRGMVAQP